MYLYTIIPSYQHLCVFTVDATWALVLMEQKKENKEKKDKKKALPDILLCPPRPLSTPFISLSLYHTLYIQAPVIYDL